MMSFDLFPVYFAKGRMDIKVNNIGLVSTAIFNSWNWEMEERPFVEGLKN